MVSSWRASLVVRPVAPDDVRTLFARLGSGSDVTTRWRRRHHVGLGATAVALVAGYFKNVESTRYPKER